jgi:gamma-glutamylcysteine synthetase
LREFSVKLGFSSFEKFTQNTNVGSLKYQSVAMELSTNSEAVGGDPATLLKDA